LQNKDSDRVLKTTADFLKNTKTLKAFD